VPVRFFLTLKSTLADVGSVLADASVVRTAKVWDRSRLSLSPIVNGDVHLHDGVRDRDGQQSVRPVREHHHQRRPAPALTRSPTVGEVAELLVVSERTV
jgi:hypothetical protein